MTAAARVFSESWYRIAEQSIELRPSVRTHRQFFRGEKWYVLHDPYNNQFFRLRPAAYEFVIRLRKGRTVEQVWEECLELFADDAPGQEEAIQVLTTLYYANLLQYRAHGDSEALFKRFKRERDHEIKSKLLGFMFPQFTLFDPDRFMQKTLPLVRIFMGRSGVALWVVVFLFGLKSFADNAAAAVDQAQGILAPSNLVWLYLCLVFVKVCHEFGHAYLCRRAGCEVHRMGVMFLVFTPLPFVDATASWSLRSRTERLRVAAAGIMVELFIASLAAVGWALTGDGLIHRLCYNVMFIASVSTVLFNANPLLRFDGYYMLSDFLDIPNLHARSRRELTYAVERYLFGRKEARGVAGTRKESIQLVVFSLASGAYRIVVFSSIIMFVADQLMIIGIVLALLFAIAWVFVPVAKFIRYIASAPELARCRSRAVGVTAAFAVMAVILLRLIPAPHSFDAPGILEARPCRRVYVRTAGMLKEVNVASGDIVAPGDEIVSLESPELELQLESAAARLAEVNARRRMAMHRDKSSLQSMDILVQAISQQRERMMADCDDLAVFAHERGRWVGPELSQLVGCWLNTGMELGWIVGEDVYTFTAVVSQSEASRLFDEQIKTAELKLLGQAGESLPVSRIRVIPMEQQELPSNSLGWRTGGEVETDMMDPSGLTAREPFFQVIADVPLDPDATLRHGLSGRIKFRLAPEPLMKRWSRRFSQMLQKRYRL